MLFYTLVLKFYLKKMGKKKKKKLKLHGKSFYLNKYLEKVIFEDFLIFLNA